MMKTIFMQRRALPIIVAVTVILLVLAGIFAVNEPMLATGADDSPNQQSAVTVAKAVPATRPAITDAPISALFTEEAVQEIQAIGGYGVVGSPISDALLVAKEGAVPIPWEQRTWGEWVDDEFGMSTTAGQTPQITNLGADLMELVSAYPENLGEVAFSSYDAFLEIYVKDTEGPGIAEIAALVEDQGMAGKVVVVQVPYSRSDMETAQDAILSAWTDDMGSISADYILSKIVFSVRTPEAEAKILAQSNNGEITVAELIATATNHSTSLDSTLAGIPVLIGPYSESAIYTDTVLIEAY